MGAVATHMIDLSDGSLKTVPDLQLGDPGVDGKTILNGSGAPAGGTGVDGDFYIDTTANEIYGPKTGGAWGSATSLVGPTGAAGADGADGADGAATWTISSVTTGAAGSSVIITNVGTSSNVDLEITIPRGSDGNSAYELAVSQGYGGSLTDWLTSLQGTDGNDGDSAYDVAVGQGFVGTVTAWLDSLVGDTGPVGPTGPAGDMTSSDIDTLAKLNAIVTDATIVDQSHTHAATAISDSTPAGRTLLTAADAAAQRTALNVEDGATADQSDAEIETAYNNQVAIVSQVDAEAGTSTTAERWTPQRVKQSIDALAPAAVEQGLNTETDGATITFDLNDSHKQTVELAGNRTLALANVSVGDVFMIRLEQDSVGSRTVTWWSTINWAGGTAPTLTTTADKTDVFIFVCTASNVYDGFIVGQNI